MVGCAGKVIETSDGAVVPKPELHPYYNEKGDVCFPRGEAVELFNYILIIEQCCENK